MCTCVFMCGVYVYVNVCVCVCVFVCTFSVDIRFCYVWQRSVNRIPPMSGIWALTVWQICSCQITRLKTLRFVFIYCDTYKIFRHSFNIPREIHFNFFEEWLWTYINRYKLQLHQLISILYWHYYSFSVNRFYLYLKKAISKFISILRDSIVYILFYTSPRFFSF